MQNAGWDRRDERVGNESRVGTFARRERQTETQGHCRVKPQGERERRGFTVRMGRFPVTLYKEQWLRILTSAPKIEAFIHENEVKLKTKE